MAAVLTNPIYSVVSKFHLVLHNVTMGKEEMRKSLSSQKEHLVQWWARGRLAGGCTAGVQCEHLKIICLRWRLQEVFQISIPVTNFYSNSGTSFLSPPQTSSLKPPNVIRRASEGCSAHAQACTHTSHHKTLFKQFLDSLSVRKWQTLSAPSPDIKLQLGRWL